MKQRRGTGNRAGDQRAPRLTASEEALLKLSRTRVRRRDGRQQEMTIEEALLLKQTDTALNGSPYAQAQVLKRLQAAQDKEMKIREEKIEFYERYCKVMRAEIAKAQARGDPEPEMPIHPDDIEFDPDRGVIFRGPITDDQHRRCAEAQAIRDALLLQTAYERRCDQGPDRDPRHDPRQLCLTLALLIERCLPERMRLTEPDCLRRMMQAEALPKRDLLKQLRAAWRAAGMDVPRGRRLPDPNGLHARLSLTLDLIERLRQSDFDTATLQTHVEDIAYERGML